MVGHQHDHQVDGVVEIDHHHQGQEDRHKQVNETGTDKDRIWIEKVKKKLEVFKYEDKKIDGEKVNEKTGNMKTEDIREEKPEDPPETLPETSEHLKLTTTHTGIELNRDVNTDSGAHRESVDISRNINKRIGIYRKGVLMKFSDLPEKIGKGKVVGGGGSTKLTHLWGRFEGERRSEDRNKLKNRDT